MVSWTSRIGINLYFLQIEIKFFISTTLFFFHLPEPLERTIRTELAPAFERDSATISILYGYQVYIWFTPRKTKGLLFASYRVFPST